MEYRSEITTQTKNNNLDYLIDQTFRNTNRLVVLSFKNGTDDPVRDSFNKYYMLLLEIQDFIALIDNKPFFDKQVKKHTRSLWQTCSNVKEQWLYKIKFIRLVVSLELL